MQEYLSSAKAKQVEGRKERGEEKRSKLRGGVERDRNVPDKSIEHERWSLQSLAELSETSFPPRFRDVHGMHAALSAGQPYEMRSSRWPFTVARQVSRNVSSKSNQAVC